MRCATSTSASSRRPAGAIATEGDQPVAVALEYTGLSPQPLFVMGEPAGGRRDPARRHAAARRPILAALPAHLAAVADVYRIQPGPPMVRMWVDRATFRPVPGAAARLLPAEIARPQPPLRPRLHLLAAGARPIANGVYYGVRVAGRLVAAAGTHVISPEARLAAVGNVMTHRDFRDRGYAKTATSAVTQELLRTCDQVVLNVRVRQPARAGGLPGARVRGALSLRGTPRPPSRRAAGIASCCPSAACCLTRKES